MDYFNCNKSVICNRPPLNKCGLLLGYALVYYLLEANPTHKLNRTLSNPNRLNPKNNTSDPRKNPVNPKPIPTQNLSQDMEVQTEKKRRREEVKKESEGNSESIKHFLSAGPGSQACQDQ
jgi:hypothetical protein